VKTGVLVRVHATSSSASARDREGGAPRARCARSRSGVGLAQGVQVRSQRERWCWRKDAAAMSGFGGGDTTEGKGSDWTRVQWRGKGRSQWRRSQGCVASRGQ
jgi:hypothetical protein